MICNNCNASIPDAVVFCPSCGKEAGAKVIINEAMSKKCLQCGAENPLEATFCRVDGWKFPEPEPGMKPVAGQESQGERICPTCGTSNPAGARFCKNDAAPLEPLEQTVLRPETAVQEKFVEQTTIWPEKETLKTNAKEAGTQRHWMYLAVPLAVLCVAAVAVYWLFPRTPVDQTPKPLPESVIAVPGGETPGTMPESATVAPGDQTSQQLPENTDAAPVVEPPQQIPDNNVAVPAVDLPRLEGQINRALRAEGLDGVTAQVNDAAVLTLKGVVKDPLDQRKALEIVKTFKEVSQVNDIIFIIEK